jgi:taurine dioxygenase
MIKVTKLADALGAEVAGIDLSKPIDAATFAAIREAWLEHAVLRFRGQRLSDPQLIAFSDFSAHPPGPNLYGGPLWHLS